MEHRMISLLKTAAALASMLALAGLGSCYYDSEEELYPGNGIICDTTNVTFSGTVFPIIQANCIICHSGGAPSGNLLLTDYQNIAAAAQTEPGQDGSLYGAISHNSGNTPMPDGGDKLDDCTILKIKTWIDQGALNN